MFVVLLVLLTVVMAMLATTVIVVTGIAHVVAQRAAGATPYRGANNPAGAAADSLTDNVAARCA